MRLRPHPFVYVVLAGALLGVLFASVSTYDFVMHLDRQVHDVHCSYIPGLSGTEKGESGCGVTLVSPYSSVFRARVWGGVPIALPAMALFAFLLFFAAELALSRRDRDPRASLLLAAATAVPVLTSMVMGYISVVQLDTVCKLCVGIYVSSAIVFTGGIGLWLAARKQPGGYAYDDDEESLPDYDTSGKAEPAWVGGQPEPAPRAQRAPRPRRPRAEGAGVTPRYLALLAALGVLFVVTPVLAYMMAAPDHERYIGDCGALPHPGDEHGLMVPIGRSGSGKVPVIEVLDPLCPTCKAFEKRLEASGLTAEMERRALLFPLDKTCNWMLSSSLHPGACAVSEAMLCAGDKAEEVLAWAFANQERLLRGAKSDPESVARSVVEQFPNLRSCVGSAEVRSRLNRSLRWAVANQLPVLTPQLYVGDVKLCDEDIDIGLEFALSRMLSQFKAGTLRARTDPNAVPPLDAGMAPDPDPVPAADAGAAAKSETPETPAAPRDAGATPASPPDAGAVPAAPADGGAAAPPEEPGGTQETPPTPPAEEPGGTPPEPPGGEEGTGKEPPPPAPTEKAPPEAGKERNPALEENR